MMASKEFHKEVSEMFTIGHRSMMESTEAELASGEEEEYVDDNE